MLIADRLIECHDESAEVVNDPRPDIPEMDPQQNRIDTLESRVKHLESELERAPDRDELESAIRVSWSASSARPWRGP